MEQSERKRNDLDRIGERHEVDASIELVVGSGKNRFWRREKVLQIRIRNISVSGALLVVPASADLKKGQRVEVRQGPRHVPMRVARVEACLDPGYELVGIGAPPNDTGWGDFVGAMIDGPGAPSGLRWLNGVR